MLFISLTFNIFILCYIGEILKNQCESVAQLVYGIDWYRVPQRKLQSFILIIAMARYPRNITAGGMMELTLRSFGDVLKTSLAYFQMLRTVTV
ncbi:odorant receptor 13a-like isoform X2 [Fopius arisanus]|nr:PREDICTED: odorant receptor 13a-like isoform X2 [Fopius arisanus]